MARVFTRTYYDLLLADVNTVTFVRDVSAANGWTMLANAGVRADDGQGYTATLSVPASAAQRTQIESFITNHALTRLNTQENLTA